MPLLVGLSSKRITCRNGLELVVVGAWSPRHSDQVIDPTGAAVSVASQAEVGSLPPASRGQITVTLEHPQPAIHKLTGAVRSIPTCPATIGIRLASRPFRDRKSVDVFANRTEDGIDPGVGLDDPVVVVGVSNPVVKLPLGRVGREVSTVGIGVNAERTGDHVWVLILWRTRGGVGALNCRSELIHPTGHKSAPIAIGAVRGSRATVGRVPRTVHSRVRPRSSAPGWAATCTDVADSNNFGEPEAAGIGDNFGHGLSVVFPNSLGDTDPASAAQAGTLAVPQGNAVEFHLVI